MNQSSKPRPGEGKDYYDDDNDDDKGEKARPEELLEDCWFFSNLLHRKLAMSSCNSIATKSNEETYQSIKKQSGRNESGPSTGLMRRPSLPPCVDRKGSYLMAKGSDVGRRKSESETTGSDNSARAPSLPTTEMSIGEEEIHDEEIEFSMGKLIRQASLSKSDVMLPANHSPKGMGMSTITGSTSPRKMEFSKLKLERLRPRRQMNQLKSQKSLSDLQSRELHGFKDLGFGLSKQELKRIEEEKGRNTNLSEAHDLAESNGERSSEDNMKAQIKFWARAVASNMRQEE